MGCFCNSWHVRNLLVMVLRLNKSLKLAELIPTPDCSGPAPAFVPCYSKYSTPRVSSTMPEKSPFHHPEFSSRKKVTSDCRRLKHIELHHPEHVQIACQSNLTLCCAPQSVQPTQHHEFNAKKDSVEDLDVFPYLKHCVHIAESESHPPPLPSAVDGNIPWRRCSAERLHCLAMGTQHSGLPGDEPTITSLLPVCDAWRVEIYPV